MQQYNETVVLVFEELLDIRERGCCGDQVQEDKVVVDHDVPQLLK
jgi:hypothetical protein